MRSFAFFCMAHMALLLLIAAPNALGASPYVTTGPTTVSSVERLYRMRCSSEKREVDGSLETYLDCHPKAYYVVKLSKKVIPACDGSGFTDEALVFMNSILAPVVDLLSKNAEFLLRLSQCTVYYGKNEGYVKNRKMPVIEEFIATQRVGANPKTMTSSLGSVMNPKTQDRFSLNTLTVAVGNASSKGFEKVAVRKCTKEVIDYRHLCTEGDDTTSYFKVHLSDAAVPTAFCGYTSFTDTVVVLQSFSSNILLRGLMLTSFGMEVVACVKTTDGEVLPLADPYLLFPE